MAALFLFFLSGAPISAVGFVVYHDPGVVSGSHAPRLILEVCSIDTLTQILEHLLYIGPVFGGDNEVVGLVHFGKLLHLAIDYHSLGLEVCLVAADSQGDSFGRVVFEFVDPLFELLKALARGNLIDDDGSQCLAVVDGCDGIVLFLTGSVLGSAACTQIASLTFCPFSKATFFSR